MKNMPHTLLLTSFHKLYNGR